MINAILVEFRHPFTFMLRFQPKSGSVIYCDYKGFISPEMIKKRPVIVISKHKHNSKLVAVVPISTSEPSTILSHHIKMEEAFCENHLSGKKSWVKCDMINVVCLDRLDLVRNRKTGDRYVPNIDTAFLNKIKEEIKKVHRL